MVDRVVGRVQLDEVDDIEPRATEQAEQLAVRQLPLHANLTGPLHSPETALRPLKRFGRRAFVGRTKSRESAVTEEPQPSAWAKQSVCLRYPAVRVAPDAGAVLGHGEVEALRG